MVFCKFIIFACLLFSVQGAPSPWKLLPPSILPGSEEHASIFGDIGSKLRGFGSFGGLGFFDGLQNPGRAKLDDIFKEQLSLARRDLNTLKADVRYYIEKFGDHLLKALAQGIISLDKATDAVQKTLRAAQKNKLEKIIKIEEFLDRNVKKNVITEGTKLKILVEAIISLVHEANLDNTGAITATIDLAKKRGIIPGAAAEKLKNNAKPPETILRKIEKQVLALPLELALVPPLIPWNYPTSRDLPPKEPSKKPAALEPEISNSDAFAKKDAAIADNAGASSVSQTPKKTDYQLPAAVIDKDTASKYSFPTSATDKIPPNKTAVLEPRDDHEIAHLDVVDSEDETLVPARTDTPSESTRDAAAPETSDFEITPDVVDAAIPVSDKLTSEPESKTEDSSKSEDSQVSTAVIDEDGESTYTYPNSAGGEVDPTESRIAESNDDPAAIDQVVNSEDEPILRVPTEAPAESTPHPPAVAEPETSDSQVTSDVVDADPADSANSGEFTSDSESTNDSLLATADPKVATVVTDEDDESKYTSPNSAHDEVPPSESPIVDPNDDSAAVDQDVVNSEDEPILHVPTDASVESTPDQAAVTGKETSDPEITSDGVDADIANSGELTSESLSKNDAVTTSADPEVTTAIIDEDGESQYSSRKPAEDEVDPTQSPKAEPEDDPTSVDQDVISSEDEPIVRVSNDGPTELTPDQTTAAELETSDSEITSDVVDAGIAKSDKLTSESESKNEAVSNSADPEVATAVIDEDGESQYTSPNSAEDEVALSEPPIVVPNAESAAADQDVVNSKDEPILHVPTDASVESTPDQAAVTGKETSNPEITSDGVDADVANSGELTSESLSKNDAVSTSADPEVTTAIIDEDGERKYTSSKPAEAEIDSTQLPIAEAEDDPAAVDQDITNSENGSIVRVPTDGPTESTPDQSAASEAETSDFEISSDVVNADIASSGELTSESESTNDAVLTSADPEVTTAIIDEDEESQYTSPNSAENDVQPTQPPIPELKDDSSAVDLGAVNSEDKAIVRVATDAPADSTSDQPSAADAETADVIDAAIPIIDELTSDSNNEAVSTSGDPQMATAVIDGDSESKYMSSNSAHGLAPNESPNAELEDDPLVVDIEVVNSEEEPLVLGPSDGQAESTPDQPTASDTETCDSMIIPDEVDADIAISGDLTAESKPTTEAAPMPAYPQVFTAVVDEVAASKIPFPNSAMDEVLPIQSTIAQPDSVTTVDVSKEESLVPASTDLPKESTVKSTANDPEKNDSEVSSASVDGDIAISRGVSCESAAKMEDDSTSTKLQSATTVVEDISCSKGDSPQPAAEQMSSVEPTPGQSAPVDPERLGSKVNLVADEDDFDVSSDASRKSQPTKVDYSTLDEPEVPILSISVDDEVRDASPKTDLPPVESLSDHSLTPERQTSVSDVTSGFVEADIDNNEKASSESQPPYLADLIPTERRVTLAVSEDIAESKPATLPPLPEEVPPAEEAPEPPVSVKPKQTESHGDPIVLESNIALSGETLYRSQIAKEDASTLAKPDAATAVIHEDVAASEDASRDSAPTDLSPAQLTPEQLVPAEPETALREVTPAIVEADVVISGEEPSQSQPPKVVDLYPPQSQATLSINDENVADSNDATVESATVEITPVEPAQKQLTPAEPGSVITPAVVKVDSNEASSKSQTVKEDDSTQAGPDSTTSSVDVIAAVSESPSPSSASSEVVPNKSPTVESASAEQKQVQSGTTRTVADVDPAVSIGALSEFSPSDVVYTESFVEPEEPSSVSRKQASIKAEGGLATPDMDLTVNAESSLELEEDESSDELYPELSDYLSKIGAPIIRPGLYVPPDPSDPTSVRMQRSRHGTNGIRSLIAI